MDAFSTVVDFLAIVRARILRNAAMEAISFALTSITFILITSTFLANWIDDLSQLRIAVVFVLLISVLIPAWLLGRRWWNSRVPSQIALYVESRDEGWHNSLLSTVEFGGLAPDAPAMRGLSPELVRQLVQSTAQQLPDIDSKKLFDQRATRFTWKIFGCLFILTVFTAMIAPHIYRDGWIRLLQNPEPSLPLIAHSFPSEKVDFLVGDFEVHYVYPAYTRTPSVTTHDGTGDLRGIPGTQIQIRGKAIRDVLGGHMALTNGELLPLTVENGKWIRGELTLTESSRFSFVLDAKNGTRLEEAHTHAIDVLEDKAPIVALLSPENEVEVNLEDQVILVYQTHDDFGLSQVDLVYTTPRENEPVHKRVQRLDGERTFRGDAVLDIADLDANPGDVVDVWIKVADEDTVSGPNYGTSRTVRVRIWSPKEKHEELVERMVQLVETFIIILADRLEAPLSPRKALLYRDGVDAISVVHHKMGAALEELKSIVTNLRQDPLMPQMIQNEIAGIVERHDTLYLAESHLLRTAVARRLIQVEHIRLLYTHNQEEVTTLEKDILQLDRLIDRLREENLLNQTRNLISQQDELTRLLEELGQNDSEEISRQAQAVLDQLQDQLDAMMQELIKQAKNLPYDNFNPGALDPEGTQKDILSFRDTLDEIRQKLAAGDIEGAKALADALQQQMAEMMAMMEQGLEGMALAGGNSEMQQQMMSMDHQLEEIIRNENKIYRDTSDVNETLREAMDAQSREQMDRFLQEVQAKTEKLRKALGDVHPSALDNEGQEQLDGMKDMTRDLKDLLGQEDWNKGEEVAEEIAKECNGLGSDVSRAASRARDGTTAKSLDKTKKNLKSAEKLAMEISEDLKGIAPNPQDFMTPDDRKKLQDLSGKQKKTSKRLGKVRQGLKKMKALPPNARDAFSELLDDAKNSMENASGELNDKHPRKAAQHEEAALEKLGRTRKKIQQMLQPDKSRMGMGLGANTEDTDIPKPEDYSVPEEFREEMMRAMKENAPHQYRERIKKYYEELAR